MQYKCQITAQRKQKPLQPSSDEQFQWMAAILQHNVPDINLDMGGLRDVGSSMGIPGPSAGNGDQTMIRNATTIMDVGGQLGHIETLNESGGQSQRTETPISEIHVKQADGDAAQNPVSVPERAETFQPLPAHLPLLVRQQSLAAQRVQPSDIRSKEDHLQRIMQPEPSGFAPAIGFVPTRPVADILVHKYFSEVNQLHCILSYNDFMPWYQRWFPDVSLPPINQAILFTVFAFGCKDEISGPADNYFLHAVNAMGPVLLNGCLEAVQALTLGVLRAFGNL
jgi:hypothetical protein